MQANPRDNTLTLIALGVLAFILADTTHEALGHGLATLAVGGMPVLLTSSYFSTSGHYSRWIPAGGGIANVILGLLALACTRLARKAAPSLLYFLFLLAAFNLLFAAAYPFYSGVALFGDWASVIAGLAPAWLWRSLLIALLALSLLARGRHPPLLRRKRPRKPRSSAPHHAHPISVIARHRLHCRSFQPSGMDQHLHRRSPCRGRILRHHAARPFPRRTHLRFRLPARWPRSPQPRMDRHRRPRCDLVCRISRAWHPLSLR
jgi:hypothetical protein